MVGKLKKFFNDVVFEMKKVSWPTKDQLKESTIVVIVVTVLITFFVLIVDTAMTKVIQAIF